MSSSPERGAIDKHRSRRERDRSRRDRSRDCSRDRSRRDRSRRDRSRRDRSRERSRRARSRDRSPHRSRKRSRRDRSRSRKRSRRDRSRSRKRSRRDRSRSRDRSRRDDPPRADAPACKEGESLLAAQVILGLPPEIELHCVDFLDFDLVSGDLKAVSKATRGLARRSLTLGWWRPIVEVGAQGLAWERPSDKVCAVFQRAWALDSRLTFRAMGQWECSWFRLKDYGSIFLSRVEPSLDGLSRIVAACEDAYLIRSAGSYILGRDGISYSCHTRENGPYCFPWPIVRAWHEIVLRVQLRHSSSRLRESWPLIGAGLEAWADQQLAATFTRDCLYYSTELHARVDTNLLDTTARTWSNAWEDRTKAGAFMAAMGRIREEISRQIVAEELREYGSDFDGEAY